jgi:hypothetical protein
VYFSCLEALQNVAKYAEASGAVIRLGNVSGDLTFEVEDDGVGFDASTTGYGTGLQAWPTASMHLAAGSTLDRREGLAPRSRASCQGRRRRPLPPSTMRGIGPSVRPRTQDTITPNGRRCNTRME